jgi:hypothetical protein
MSRILTAALFVLTLSVPALAGTVPEGATVWKQRPTGAGKPDAISCYQEVAIGSHIRNLQCAPNSAWARVSERARMNAGGPFPLPDTHQYSGARLSQP